jgi:ectoine hydroxylase-related dioxygenase (phytanoyl-CoA dioxygenase family)
VQVFLMYYLIDTNRQNGCLRVIPGSHRRRHRLHALPPAHGANFAAAGEGHAAFQPDPDEVDVPVRAGDLLIGDARLIHSAHPNRSAQRRTVITLWFVPAFGELSEHLQAFYGRFGGKAPERPTGWTDASWRQLEPILARYDGAAEPATSIRIPNARLL